MPAFDRRNGYDSIKHRQLTYAANLASLRIIDGHQRYFFRRADICDREKVSELLREFDPDAILHLAAESHVDRSIDGPSQFIKTNIEGTVNRQCALLRIARRSFYYRPRPESAEELDLLKKLDRIFTNDPLYGSRRLQVALLREGFRSAVDASGD